MKKRLIFSLLGLFLLFSLGTVLSVLYSYRITQDLGSVITLHRIEIIRQNFVINIQTVQANLYATGTIFGKELDTVVENVSAMDDSVQGCLGCHHTKEMTDRLHQVGTMVEQYKEAISYLVTSTANEQRIERLKMVAVGIGDSLLTKTQEMATLADNTLRSRTVTAVSAIGKSRMILVVTLIMSFLLALGIAFVLTRQVTRPLLELVKASRMIASGKLGYRTEYKDNTEFGEVADSFNAMSSALQIEREKTDHHIEQLSGLYRITLSFYDILEMEQTFQDICSNISSIIRARQTTLLLLDETNNLFMPLTSDREISEQTRQSFSLTLDRMVALYQKSDGHTIVMNEPSAYVDFEPLSPAAEEGNALVAWLLTKEKILGAIRVTGKADPFTEEDAKILLILANHMAVAMENAELYRDLQANMLELRETQEQLIQSAKLAAIGELASNVAHEINNPLTSIIGFTELSKEDDDIEAIKKSLDIIEKESLRARDIVRQLLGFARKKPLQLTDVQINDVIHEVVSFSASQTRMGKVRVVEDYSGIPATTGDIDQLKQVFLNLITNAIHAMPEGGTLRISTSMQGDYILAKFEDSGHGIPATIRQRIFEPFFTTKKEKGTGLGLSISYRIIQDHGGRLEVESETDKGSTFIIRLPQKQQPVLRPAVSA